MRHNGSSFIFSHAKNVYKLKKYQKDKFLLICSLNQLVFRELHRLHFHIMRDRLFRDYELNSNDLEKYH